MSDINKIRAIILHAAKEIVALLEVPPILPLPVPSQEECAEILREAAEPPKKRGRPAKAKLVEQAPAVTICSPETPKEPEIQPHQHELAAQVGGTAVSVVREDLLAEFDGNNPDHKALVSEWAKEAAVDANWKRTYADHIFKSLLKGKKVGEVYETLDNFLKDLDSSARLFNHYQKTIVEK